MLAAPLRPTGGPDKRRLRPIERHSENRPAVEPGSLRTACSCRAGLGAAFPRPRGGASWRANAGRGTEKRAHQGTPPATQARRPAGRLRLPLRAAPPAASPRGGRAPRRTVRAARRRGLPRCRRSRFRLCWCNQRCNRKTGSTYPPYAARGWNTSAPDWGSEHLTGKAVPQLHCTIEVAIRARRTLA